MLGNCAEKGAIAVAIASSMVVFPKPLSPNKITTFLSGDILMVLVGSPTRRILVIEILLKRIIDMLLVKHDIFILFDESKQTFTKCIDVLLNIFLYPFVDIRQTDVVSIACFPPIATILLFLVCKDTKIKPRIISVLENILCSGVNIFLHQKICVRFLGGLSTRMDLLCPPPLWN